MARTGLRIDALFRHKHAIRRSENPEPRWNYETDPVYGAEDLHGCPQQVACRPVTHRRGDHKPAGEVLQTIKVENPFFEAVYERYCVSCHGELGDGNGEFAAWLTSAEIHLPTSIA